MSLSDLASLGSFISGIAVLTSLIYLALQVRQTKRNQQIAIRHTRASRVVELHLALADAGVANAWLHGVGSPEDITTEDSVDRRWTRGARRRPPRGLLHRDGRGHVDGAAVVLGFHQEHRFFQLADRQAEARPFREVL